MIFSTILTMTWRDWLGGILALASIAVVTAVFALICVAMGVAG